MVKFVTLYRRSDDDTVIDDFFHTTHLPLAEQLPHLLKREVSRVTHKPGGESRFYLMVELYFATKEEMEMALLSATGRSLIKALAPWGEAKIVTWFYAEAWEE